MTVASAGTRFRARWWLVGTVLLCAVLGLTPLVQALEYVRVASMVPVALWAQVATAVLWLLLAQPLAHRWSLVDSEGRALAVLATVALVICGVASAIILLIVQPPSPYRWSTSWQLVVLGWLPTHAITAGLISLVGSWTDARRQRARAADREAVLQATLVQAELEALRARLEPHFLLNALNTVSGLARRGEGERASEVAADLGDLLRFALTESSDAVPFDAEREIVERYLAIEQARLGDRLHITWHIDASVRPVALPALVWQPLVENAIRHGIARRSTPGRVVLSAHCENDIATLTVDADGPEDGVDAEPSPFGGLRVGVATTRRRLALLYGGAASLAFTERPGGMCATLVLPARRPEAP
ncbi:sensor histidine kinase [Gemmatimonas phototrophica]|uniref:sensor histidine kinase n=1 Tax=Gemmatimonas phototrophica TaxID=1379270 RepID=UPI0009EDFBA4|nr:histidine kinase [Gemmatimonas phototrophica]